MKYGELPKQLETIDLKIEEMFFYQYLPIKLPGTHEPIFEKRLSCLNVLVGSICCHFIAEYGLNRYIDSYVYLTAKNLYQSSGCAFNRLGYHSDGFLTDDINYIWSNRNPTVFNNSTFDLTLDDFKSINEMSLQALPENDIVYSDNTILRLNQFNIHKVGKQNEGMRAFIKMSFSKDKYDLKGNSHNHLLEYNWEMRDRKPERNVPQILVALA